MASRTEPIPAVAAALGAAGLVPFVAGAAFAWLAAADLQVAIPVLVAYGAIILSFLGGAHWGLASAAAATDLHGARPSLFAWSVVPSLVGWVACLLSLPLSLAVLAVAFTLVLILDRQMMAQRLAPGWWWRLRIRLTVAVVTTLLVALAGVVRAGLLFDL